MGILSERVYFIAHIITVLYFITHIMISLRWSWNVSIILFEYNFHKCHGKKKMHIFKSVKYIFYRNIQVYPLLKVFSLEEFKRSRSKKN